MLSISGSAAAEKCKVLLRPFFPTTQTGKSLLNPFSGTFRQRIELA